MNYSTRQATAAEYLAAMINIHGERVTGPLDSDDDQGTIIWFASVDATVAVADRLGRMVELFDGNAIYIHPEYSAALLFNYRQTL